MYKLNYLLLALFLISACSASKELATAVNENEITNAETEAAVEIAATADKNWHMESISNSPYYGIEADRAYREILATMQPKKKVVVAVIDSGTDITHEDLSANIWINRGEIPGNGIDDDGNGYIDDIHGWNFIGGSDGSNVEKDTYEITRLYAELAPKFADADSSALPDNPEYETFMTVRNEYEQKKAAAESSLNQIEQISLMINWSKAMVKVSSLDSLNAEILVINNSDGDELKQAKQILNYYYSIGIKDEDLTEAYDHFENEVQYGYNLDFDSRHLVGDNYKDLTDRFYGNNNVAGVHNEHGTHVAGIIGAVRNNNVGMNGIAGNVALMILRAVPDGDERDKDIANAVRYAVDNGADIINMSFGKGFSPEKEYVDAAFKYADESGVLVIHSAGNEGSNNDSTLTYPNKFFLDGTEAQNFITVGASSWSAAGDSALAASFSNYGSTVDIFAPGVEVYSTMPGNEYKALSGTSMAGPVVAGAAALIMSYFPELNAAEVKHILLASVTKTNGIYVLKPGSDEVVPFSSLSSTGGIVNVYNALKMALTH